VRSCTRLALKGRNGTLFQSPPKELSLKPQILSI